VTDPPEWGSEAGEGGGVRPVGELVTDPAEPDDGAGPDSEPKPSPGPSVAAVDIEPAGGLEPVDEIGTAVGRLDGPEDLESGIAGRVEEMPSEEEIGDDVLEDGP
jgi:hypothetical protein